MHPITTHSPYCIEVSLQRKCAVVHSRSRQRLDVLILSLVGQIPPCRREQRPRTDSPPDHLRPHRSFHGSDAASRSGGRLFYHGEDGFGRSRQRFSRGPRRRSPRRLQSSGSPQQLPHLLL